MKKDDYVTDEGLTPSSFLKWDGSQLQLSSGEKVWVPPNGRGVFKLLRERADLWQIAQIRVLPQNWISARAPIFGVPFDIALEQLLRIPSHRDRPIKSMFQRVDGPNLESNRTGVVATMVAHVSFDAGAAGPELTLEMSYEHRIRLGKSYRFH